MKKILSLILLIISTKSFAQAVVVTGITDPSFINMSIQSMKTNVQLFNQLMSSVNDIKRNYETVASTTSIKNAFSNFAGLYGSVASFMNTYLCRDCAPNIWDKKQFEQLEKGLSEDVAHILEAGEGVYANIGKLSKDIDSLTKGVNFNSINPAHMAAVQAQLLGTLGAGIEQVNTLLNSAIHLQSVALARTQLQEQNAYVTGVNAMNNFGQSIKP